MYLKWLAKWSLNLKCIDGDFLNKNENNLAAIKESQMQHFEKLQYFKLFSSLICTCI